MISGHLIHERQFRTQSQSLFNDDYDKHTAPPKLTEGKKNIIFEHSEVIQIFFYHSEVKILESPH